MCIQHTAFNRLIASSNFSSNILHCVVDEAHCIATWGPKFREAWGELSRIRSLLPSTCPVLATTATATPQVVSTICTVLEIEQKQTFYLNLGNNRPNIIPIFVEVAGKTAALDFVLRLVKNRPADQDIPKTVIFFNERDTAQRVCDKLREYVPVEKQGRIAYIHALRHENGKKKVMFAFHNDEIRILCSTDCSGLVSTFSNISSQSMN
jgi:superfamily II DNA helicase RecQ